MRAPEGHEFCVEPGAGGQVTPMPMLIGTSGWQYRDWRGGLYPEGMAQRRWLEHYASYYLTVENNDSFYRLPPRDVRRLAGAHPGDFVMAVKASRYLTHVRRLRDPAEPVARLLGAAAALGAQARAGPAAAAADAEGRPGYAGRLPDGVPDGGRRPRRARRSGSRWNRGTDLVDREIRQILAAHDATLCWADRRRPPVTPLWRTASGVICGFTRARPIRGPATDRAGAKVGGAGTADMAA